MANPKNTRRCTVCRDHSDKSEMIRVVRTPNGFSVDKTGSADGRGAYIHRTAECVSTAIKKRSLNAAFKTSVPESVYESLKEEL